MFGLHFKKSARTHTHTAAHIPSGNVISTTIVKHLKHYFPEIGISSSER